MELEGGWEPRDGESPEAALARKIETYKRRVEAGEIARASWPHFAAFLGRTEAELSQAMAGRDGIALALKRFATWVRGEMLSAPGWGGPMNSRAALALRQDVGDGVRYLDKETASGPVEVRVIFGGGDPRAEEAAK